MRNSIFSTVFGFRRFLFLLTTSPAFEKTRSQGTDEAGIQSKSFASLNKLGYTFLWLLQYKSGSSDLSRGGSVMYRWTSTVASAVAFRDLLAVAASWSIVFHRLKAERETQQYFYLFSPVQ